MKPREISRTNAVLAGMAVGVTALAIGWLLGFAWFLHGALRAGAPSGRADGIVVLTGGADRIITGIHLLQQGRGDVLLISGVGHNADLADLLRGTGIDPAPLAPRITLGHSAITTIGNADETATWVQAKHLRSLLVVTATYHMRRAMTELQRSLPRTRLIAYPVLPPALRAGDVFTNLAALRLLAQEYTKFLAAELDLTRLEAEPDLRAPDRPNGPALPPR